jgi:hypothetical protein
MRYLKHYIAQAVHSAETPFAALVFLGSLRDAYSGLYIHEGWGQMASAEEIHSVLRETHQLVFNSVLGLSLIDLTRQLRAHFQSLKQPERETSVWWLEIEPFRDLIPQGCSVVSRDLFVSKIKTSLGVLCHAPGWSDLAVAQGASPQRQLDRSPLLHWLN